jgi:hypothetical protein
MLPEQVLELHDENLSGDFSEDLPVVRFDPVYISAGMGLSKIRR